MNHLILLCLYLTFYDDFSQLIDFLNLEALNFQASSLVPSIGGLMVFSRREEREFKRLVQEHTIQTIYITTD